MAKRRLKSRMDARTRERLAVLPVVVRSAAVAVWHFWLHQQLRDPDLPHVLLALSQLGLYVGTLMIGAGLVLPRCRQKYMLSRAEGVT